MRIQKKQTKIKEIKFFLKKREERREKERWGGAWMKNDTNHIEEASYLII